MTPAGTEAATPSRRLAALGLALPAVPAPAGAYLPARRHAELVWTAGQLPLVDGTLAVSGQVGAAADGGMITPDRATELARICALNALAAAAAAAGGLDALTGIVKVVGFVASVPAFTGQPAVVNGASELLAAVFGDAGRHARSAVGVAVLPMGAPVEIELVATICSNI
ncbi:RidA family protein [Frankia sp. CiP3]|uniref:RidA family protein n=1 Tax=Frankia sp. CiP3 TaxID=2880971 RepID=UPI001EF3DEF4|nr:RidA family protein [Frankia sp. CiP3]